MTRSPDRRLTDEDHGGPLHPRWVTTVRCGSRKVTELTDRGHAILNLTVPVHVRGFGPYRGLSWKKR